MEENINENTPIGGIDEVYINLMDEDNEVFINQCRKLLDEYGISKASAFIDMVFKNTDYVVMFNPIDGNITRYSGIHECRSENSAMYLNTTSNNNIAIGQTALTNMYIVKKERDADTEN